MILAAYEAWRSGPRATLQQAERTPEPLECPCEIFSGLEVEVADDGQLL